MIIGDLVQLIYDPIRKLDVYYASEFYSNLTESLFSTPRPIKWKQSESSQLLALGVLKAKEPLTLLSFNKADTRIRTFRHAEILEIRYFRTLMEYREFVQATQNSLQQEALNSLTAKSKGKNYQFFNLIAQSFLTELEMNQFRFLTHEDSDVREFFKRGICVE